MNEVRISKVRKKLKEAGLDGVFISSPVNCFYLTNFEKPSGDFRAIQLLITPSQIYILTNPLYEGSVRNWLPTPSARGRLANPHEIRIIVTSARRGLIENLRDLAGKNKIKALGFEAKDLRLTEYLKIKSSLKEVDLLAADDIFTDLRKIKDENEINSHSEAARITDLAFRQILKILKAGLTEKEVAAEIDYLLRKNGADGSAFETIVAGGPNSAIPHHKTGDRKIKSNEIVLLDFGARFGGYCSDMTRVVALGKVKKEVRDAYQEVLRSQETALAKIKPGMSGREADEVARRQLRGQKLAKYFIHNLGHNIGLNIHEPPSLGPRDPEKIEEGMVFSVEPGVYFNGKFGIRIEDTVVARKNGLELLTHSPKDLLEL